MEWKKFENTYQLLLRNTPVLTLEIQGSKGLICDKKENKQYWIEKSGIFSGSYTISNQKNQIIGTICPASWWLSNLKVSFGKSDFLIKYINKPLVTIQLASSAEPRTILAEMGLSSAQGQVKSGFHLEEAHLKQRDFRICLGILYFLFHPISQENESIEDLIFSTL